MEQEQLESEKLSIKRQISMRIIVILMIIVATVIVIYFTLNQKIKKAELISVKSAELASKKNQSKILDSIAVDFLSQNYKQGDLNTVSSALGFSLKYPYKDAQFMLREVDDKDDPKFQASFIFPTRIASEVKEEEEKIHSDLKSLNYYSELDMKVLDLNDSANFDSWIEETIKKEKAFKEDQRKVLSKEIEKISIAGLDGAIIVRKIEFGNNEFSLQIAYKDIFIHKDDVAYHFSYIAPLEETTFPKSGTIGKEYLQQVETLSIAIIKTFVFDGSKITAVGIPKNVQPEISGDAALHREELLMALRKEPFIDEKAVHSILDDEEQCSPKTTGNADKSIYKKELRPSSGIYIGVDKEFASLHAYDANGGHTGSVPRIVEYKDRFMIEERARGFDSIMLGSIGYGIAMYENLPGRIEIIGKDFAFAEFRITGDGNSCLINQIYLPVTPYSIYTLHVNESGDMGPLSCDIDGDGKEDFKLSLVHPLFSHKAAELNAVIEDMKNIK